MDSVTLSGAWRTRYSRKASVKSRLRDLRVRRARRSAPSNRSLGMEIAVFIPGGSPHDQFLSKSVVPLHFDLSPSSCTSSALRMGDVGQRQRSAITSSMFSHKMLAQISPGVADAA